MKNNRTTLLSLSVVVACCIGVVDAGPAHADSEWEVSGASGLHLFSGDNELGTYETPVESSPSNSWIITARLSRALAPRIAAEAELGFARTRIRDSDSSVALFTYRLQGLFHFAGKDAKLRPFALLGAGAMTSSSSDQMLIEDDTDLVAHVGGGLKYRLNENWLLRADLRAYVPPSTTGAVTLEMEALVGASFAFSRKKDSDHDGLLDVADRCPNAAEDRDGFEDLDGCPDPDNDGDQVADVNDRCAADKEDLDGFEDEDGCPDMDNDGDGIADASDKCPMEAEDMDGFSDEDGCPDADNDMDGMADANDKCPMEAEDMDGFEDEDGCPDVDNDGDGVADMRDQCPMEAEDMDSIADEDGCPETDYDGDGMLDALDACPSKAGPKGNKGCPDVDRDGDGVVDRLDKCPDEKGETEQQGCDEWTTIKGERISPNE